MSYDEFEKIFINSFTSIHDKQKEYIEDCFTAYYMTNASTANMGNEE